VTNIILERIKSGEINPREELGIKEGSLMTKKSEEQASTNRKRACC